jgi:hypothetical protein
MINATHASPCPSLPSVLNSAMAHLCACCGCYYAHTEPLFMHARACTPRTNMLLSCIEPCRKRAHAQHSSTVHAHAAHMHCPSWTAILRSAAQKPCPHVHSTTVPAHTAHKHRPSWAAILRRVAQKSSSHSEPLFLHIPRANVGHHGQQSCFGVCRNCAHTYTHTHANTPCTHVHTCTRMHAHSHTQCAHTQTCTRARMHTHAHIHTENMHTHAYANTHATWRSPAPL